MAKRGPKSGFNNKIVSTVSRLVKDGKTEEQIAEIIGVSRMTLHNWKGRHPELLYAMRESKQMADELVEAALFSRAQGYSHPEQKVFCTKDGDIITHNTLKHYPPDSTAAMFWLRNRQPKKWREKTESDTVVNNINNVTQLSDEQLEAKIAEKLAKKEKK
jgi:hypothetical protein